MRCSPVPHGVAPPEALDQLGYEPPVDWASWAGPSVTTDAEPPKTIPQPTPSDDKVIPNTRVIPPTPMKPGIDGEGADTSSPKVVGRIPNDVQIRLDEGFKGLDRELKLVADNTGMPPQQVLDLWQKSLVHHTKSPNYWNYYAAYFADFTEQELARIRPEEEPPVGMKNYGAYITSVP